MTLEETAKLVFLLKEFYPNSPDNTTPDNRVKAWHMVMQNCDFAAAKKAAIEFVKKDTKGFFPAVGQIIALMSQECESVAMLSDPKYFEKALLEINEMRMLV